MPHIRQKFCDLFEQIPAPSAFGQPIDSIRPTWDLVTRRGGQSAGIYGDQGTNKQARGTNVMDAVEFDIVDVLNSEAKRPFETTVHRHAAPSP
jgi:hypothetical protein